MNKFSWYDANTVEEALEQVSATVSETLQPEGPSSAAVFKSGGVDLLDLIKEGLATPSRIINIRNIPGLDQISYDAKEGLRMGANVTLAQMEAHADIRSSYLALHLAVAHAATPQLRNMASLGGNLAQRTRCWYFRSIEHQCFRKGSGTCFARHGENEFHAIMKNGACSSVHSSSISTALLAFGASVEIAGANGIRKTVPMEEFFVLPGDDSRRETILEVEEIITAVVVPPVSKKTKSFYIKHGAMESHDWPIADVAVVMELSGSVCKNASVVLGAAAPVPFKSKQTGEALTGKSIDEGVAVNAAEFSMKGATPLEHNAYKVAVFKAIVKRAILETV